MKGFFYDTILDEENICNLESEKRQLQEGIRRGEKLVVYGPRNFGKTSLVKNVVLPAFRRRHKKAFTLFVDLMEVKSLEAIHQRIQIGFEKAFGEAFPAKRLLTVARQLLFQLRPEISVDPLTGHPTLALGTSRGQSHVSFVDIFDLMRKKIAGTMPVCIVLDEFQDIAFVDEAQGLFRNALQAFHQVPMILMGSKRHILSRIFATPEAPLASFGADVEFTAIPYEAYHAYMMERFQMRGLSMTLATATELQNQLFRNPEAMNMVCADLFETHTDQAIEWNDVLLAMDHVVQKRRSRFEQWMSHVSQKEEEVLTALAHHGPIPQPLAQSFLQHVHVSIRTVSQTIEKFHDKSMVEKAEDGYRIADPLLAYFLRVWR